MPQWIVGSKKKWNIFVNLEQLWGSLQVFPFESCTIILAFWGPIPLQYYSWCKKGIFDLHFSIFLIFFIVFWSHLYILFTDSNMVFYTCFGVVEVFLYFVNAKRNGVHQMHWFCIVFFVLWGECDNLVYNLRRKVNCILSLVFDVYFLLNILF